MASVVTSGGFSGWRKSLYASIAFIFTKRLKVLLTHVNDIN
jgi:hypothetical protein